jgi:hypothetical protein
MQRLLPVITVLGKWRKEGHEFKASLGYIVRQPYTGVYAEKSFAHWSMCPLR